MRKIFLVLALCAIAACSKNTVAPAEPPHVTDSEAVVDVPVDVTLVEIAPEVTILMAVDVTVTE